MDSGSPAADGPGGGVGESRRWSDLKVYTRRRRGKKKGAPETAAENPQPSSHETLATTTTTVELQSSIQQPLPPIPPPPAPPPQCDRRASSDDEASSRHRDENNYHRPETVAENLRISSLGPPDSVPTTANLQSSPQRQPAAASPPRPHQRLSSDDEASRHGGKNASPEAAGRKRHASFHEPMATTTAAVDLQSSLQRPPPVAPPPQQCHHVSSGDEASSLNLLSSEAKAALDCQASVPHQNGFAEDRNDQLPQEEVRELRWKLLADLHQMRGLYKRLEARHLQLLAAPFSVAGGGSGAPSQHSMTLATTPVWSKKAPVVLDIALAAPVPFRPQLNLSLPCGVGARNSIGEPMMEKEKRTPKANQFFHSSDFILGKDRLPPPASHKKPKSSKSKMQSMEDSDYSTSTERKIYANAFKSCRALLEKLMKHKHGWVFNKPVDVEGLRLYDYFSIIKHPMDLGTVKSRLNDNFYETPDEFAADVRLTFRNATTYNPKGQDVHIMAEQLSNLFEERWVVIDADLTEHLHQLYLVNKRRAPPTDSRRTLERSGSTVQPVVVDLKTEQIQHQHFSRPTALKKPKANDLNKRDMTLKEKQTLSRHLQSLPPEKMDAVIQIINKKNSALNLHDDEIEVDIDSVDAETLWELDRFVINYKKALSKNKRKAELAMLAKAEAERQNQERLNGGSPDAVVAVAPPETNNVVEEKKVTASLTVPGENNGDNVSGSSDSGNSSSDSGSSDSDSDSESSSSYESDAAHSAGT